MGGALMNAIACLSPMVEFLGRFSSISLFPTLGGVRALSFVYDLSFHLVERRGAHQTFTFATAISLSKHTRFGGFLTWSESGERRCHE
ncbi:hypothetical protein IE53DRAFT_232624 [Violaceomyces palustris]|uniref:Uncharacterized protein n=1 Tax=Violaceomyces palustris TaxID=1673888 RepID=A0ACD0P4H7_9BASI|nr:hypothetical protein IE53DRAFT_232624 [Violaceomyces palustris]